MRNAGVLALAGLVLSGLSGCAGRRSVSGAEVLNMTEDRVADLLVTRKTTGRKEFLFFSMRRDTEFLEGFIKGRVLDWDGNPVEGVRIDPVLDVRKSVGGGRRIPRGRATRIASQQTAFEASYFDSAVSNAAGDYAIRFSVPIIDGIVDVRGTFQYNPGWEQRVEEIGGDYEPHVQNSQFRIYYSKKFRFLVFAEGPREIVVRPRTKTGVAAPPGAGGRVKARAGRAKKKNTRAQEGLEDDLFKGLFGE